MLKENNIARREARQQENVIIEEVTLDNPDYKLQRMLQKLNEDYCKDIRPYTRSKSYRHL